MSGSYPSNTNTTNHLDGHYSQHEYPGNTSYSSDELSAPATNAYEQYTTLDATNIGIGYGQAPVQDLEYPEANFQLNTPMQDTFHSAIEVLQNQEQNEPEELGIGTKIEVKEGSLYLDNKHVLHNNGHQMLVDAERTIAVNVTQGGIDVHHKYSNPIHIGHTHNATYCCVLQQEQSIWVMTYLNNKFVVYDCKTGVLLKVFETTAKEGIVQWRYSNNCLAYLTKDNQLCIAEQFDQRLQEIEVPLPKMNRKNIKMMTNPGGWMGQTYDIHVDSTEEHDVIKAVCSMFGYEESDFEYKKKSSEVVLKNNCYSKLRRIKVTSEHQGVDCFLILNGVIWAHCKQQTELIKIPLTALATPDSFQKQMETLHQSRSYCLQMIADDEGDYIVFKCRDNEAKLLVYRKNQGKSDMSANLQKDFKDLIEVNLKGSVRYKNPKITIQFTKTKHILSVEFYYPILCEGNRFRGQINLQSEKPVLQNLRSVARQ